MTSNVFEHPFLSGLLGDPDMAKLFSAQKDIACMLKFEVAIADAQSELGIIPRAVAQEITDCVQTFKPDMNRLNIATATDGVVVPELIRQLRALLGDAAGKSLHIGATSQDVIDTSLVLRLKLGMELLSTSITSTTQMLDSIYARFGANTIMARTRMQNAMPSTVGQVVNNWRVPIDELSEQLCDVSQKVAVLQLGGAIGDGEVFGEPYQELVGKLAQKLELCAPARSWHTNRISIGNLANWLSMVSGSLGKIGRDIALMNMNEISEIKLDDTGGSSAMPHKKNPVKAEILVTLANYNAAQLSAVHNAMVHENNRSGSAWTLEWMVLPQMMMASAASLRTANMLLDSVQEFGKRK